MKLIKKGEKIQINGKEVIIEKVFKLHTDLIIDSKGNTSKTPLIGIIHKPNTQDLISYIKIKPNMKICLTDN